MTEHYLGDMNGHVVARVLKETVRRAMVTIRSERFAFEAQEKVGYDDEMDDVCTSADRKAQAIYLRMFEECFPLCGVIGEEDSLRVEPKEECMAYFTVDPLDGTKAFVRRQSHGVATMVALVADGEVISAYIGDINSDEVYGYRPGSRRVFRISRLDTYEQLVADPVVANSEFFGLLRDPAHEYSFRTQELLKRFKSYESMGSSIGTWLARLWKREVSAAILRPSFETPWDSTPVIGISKMLGYVFLRPCDSTVSGWEEYEPELPTEPIRREHDTLVISRQDARILDII